MDADDRSLTPEDAASLLNQVLSRLETLVLGQRFALERLVIALLADGHVLLEGPPGLAKTRTVRALAQSLDLPFRRIQFTPDLLPADLTGSEIFRPALGDFVARPGPIFASVLLADEINRAPAKVQSALLEAMQERQVTIGERSLPLPDPFWVLATQNPIEHEGVYPLPEAQLDRFLFKLEIGYPDRDAELAILDLPDDGDGVGSHEPILDQATVRRLRQARSRVHVAAAIKEYVVDLVRATRDFSLIQAPKSPGFAWGASPRAALSWKRAAQARALSQGRDYVVPHDVKSLARETLCHRVVIDDEAEAQGLTAESLIARILDRVRVP